MNENQWDRKTKKLWEGQEGERHLADGQEVKLAQFWETAMESWEPKHSVLHLPLSQAGLHLPLFKLFYREHCDSNKWRTGAT
jgi:hypothetical protein